MATARTVWRCRRVFRAPRLSLLDRGFAYAIAHVRGGDELGYAWYEAGKLDQRTNTFNDFIDVAQYLIQRRYTGAGKLVAAGGSAGGTLTGAVANDAPELWGAVVSHVPFVDVLNTILDDTLAADETGMARMGQSGGRPKPRST